MRSLASPTRPDPEHDRRRRHHRDLEMQSDSIAGVQQPGCSIVPSPRRRPSALPALRRRRDVRRLSRAPCAARQTRDFAWTPLPGLDLRGAYLLPVPLADHRLSSSSPTRRPARSRPGRRRMAPIASRHWLRRVDLRWGERHARSSPVAGVRRAGLECRHGSPAASRRSGRPRTGSHGRWTLMPSGRFDLAIRMSLVAIIHRRSVIHAGTPDRAWICAVVRHRTVCDGSNSRLRAALGAHDPPGRRGRWLSRDRVPVGKGSANVSCHSGCARDQALDPELDPLRRPGYEWYLQRRSEPNGPSEGRAGPR